MATPTTSEEFKTIQARIRSLIDQWNAMKSGYAEFDGLLKWLKEDGRTFSPIGSVVQSRNIEKFLNGDGDPAGSINDAISSNRGLAAALQLQESEIPVSTGSAGLKAEIRKAVTDANKEHDRIRQIRDAYVSVKENFADKVVEGTNLISTFMQQVASGKLQYRPAEWDALSKADQDEIGNSQPDMWRYITNLPPAPPGATPESTSKGTTSKSTTTSKGGSGAGAGTTVDGTTTPTVAAPTVAAPKLPSIIGKYNGVDVYQPGSDADYKTIGDKYRNDPTFSGMIIDTDTFPGMIHFQGVGPGSSTFTMSLDSIRDGVIPEVITGELRAQLEELKGKLQDSKKSSNERYRSAGIPDSRGFTEEGGSGVAQSQGGQQVANYPGQQKELAQVGEDGAVNLPDISWLQAMYKRDGGRSTADTRMMELSMDPVRDERGRLWRVINGQWVAEEREGYSPVDKNGQPWGANTGFTNSGSSWLADTAKATPVEPPVETPNTASQGAMQRSWLDEENKRYTVPVNPNEWLVR